MCDLSEFPLSKILVQGIGMVQSAEVKIHPAVIVDITGGNTRSIEENLVGEVPLQG